MKSAIKIGRDNTNDVIINEPSISRNHAIVTSLNNGTYEVKDLGSSNGTFINGKRITLAILSPGDKLKVATSMVDWETAFQAGTTKKTDSLIMENEFARIRKTIMIGSSENNDIVLENTFVSGHHAKISVLRNGNYYLQDMGSSNGCFVNGAKVISKNFSKTDVVKIADADLPNDWFLHKNLRLHFLKDHKKGIWISFAAVLLLAGGTLSYINRCSWFGLDCNLSARQLYVKNQNALVMIEHEYYYTAVFNGIKYYIGKNKDFPQQTEANPDKKNLLAYSRISGNGCLVKPGGSILTSPVITNPWLYNEEEKAKALVEVVASKTIKGLNKLNSNLVSLCGETTVLKWMPNGVINNQQNFTEATVNNLCSLSDSVTVVIRSVKDNLPPGAVVADHYFGSGESKPMHNTAEKYYAVFNPPQKGEVLKDTFYARKDSFDINKISMIPIADSLPVLSEGSAVFNARGELIGIIQQQRVHLLQNYIKQIKQ